ncbi:MAG: type IIA DNA topoisomerase subunit B [Deltaproteobacteria bacterium]|nr:MAG: type IIA DNA topoisomerase subunit B [Deltaproteobacteria bacterium]
MAATGYTAKDITVLEGLEPVRKRPAMYIGGTGKAGYHHLLWEIVDNAIDEVINKHATRIEVTLHADGKTVTVSDNGRGIPVDPIPKYKKPALEVILCTLHAGGKFDGKNYVHSGGLHGVGASVVNALSEELVAAVKRGGKTYTQRFSRGVPKTKLTASAGAKGTGTTITFRPDPDLFGDKLAFDPRVVRDRLEAKSYLHRGVRIVWRDETRRPAERAEFHHDDGIAEYLAKVIAERGKRAVPPGSKCLYLEVGGDHPIEVALQWTEATDEHIRSYVNGVPTPAGGTHENGLKTAVVKAVREYMTTHKLAPKGLTITADDVREGLVAILSVYVGEPQFQGQTKDRLNNPEVQPAVEAIVRPAVVNWLNANGSIADAIAARVIMSARAREASRAAAAQVKRKTAVSHRLNLPGKLADCASTDPSESELFLVEGDSAGGSAKQGRDRRTQAILPLRGKVLNAEQATTAKLLANKELQNIISALGTDFGPKFDISKLRYDRIFLLMDADADGHHIATLLLAFFYRHMPELIERGHVYLAQPPLYRIDIGKQTYWALDDLDKERILRDAPANARPSITRFKGLGEMSPNVLWETTLNPATRTALRVRVPDGERVMTDAVIADLLGKDAAARYRLITEGAPDVDELDL